jgi:hypothetical protein
MMVNPGLAQVNYLISPQLNVHELLLPWDAEQGTVYSIVQQ